MKRSVYPALDKISIEPKPLVRPKEHDNISGVYSGIVSQYLSKFKFLSFKKLDFDLLLILQGHLKMIFEYPFDPTEAIVKDKLLKQCSIDLRIPGTEYGGCICNVSVSNPQEMYKALSPWTVSRL